jgi:hypothetical protein
MLNLLQKVLFVLLVTDLLAIALGTVHVLWAEYKPEPKPEPKPYVYPVWQWEDWEPEAEGTSN